eukprot:2909848-Pyramimonas_sp.AAC.1
MRSRLRRAWRALIRESACSRRIRGPTRSWPRLRMHFRGSKPRERALSANRFWNRPRLKIKPDLDGLTLKPRPKTHSEKSRAAVCRSD